MPGDRKKILLRLDPAVHDALARWAGEELRSTNAQIEFVLRQALAEAGRLPGRVDPIRQRGRPRRDVSRDVSQDVSRAVSQDVSRAVGRDGNGAGGEQD